MVGAEIEGLAEGVLLGGDGAEEVVGVGEERESSAAEVEGGREGGEEERGSLEVGLGVGGVVGVPEEELGGAETDLDLHHGIQPRRRLADRLHALYRLPGVAAPLVLLRQPPQPLRHRFHFTHSLHLSLSLLDFPNLRLAPKIVSVSLP